ncbi:SDR family oxidoreductase [Streptomyces olivaceiscleroticus]|uniref:3-ketoacyl-ACP reductase n=1 Tax=Streptomyces olivaceiscleroticus TaxID=68245 RepID=A0ABN1AIF8_9ACTN
MPKTALVTGAGRGIGRAIAIRLAAEGFRVGITARSTEQLKEVAATIEAAGGVVAVAPGDATVAENVAEVERTVSAALGPIDLLVNNAGYASAPMPFIEVDPADWWRVVETNVLGPMLFTHAVLPSMLKRGSGHIININSMMGSKLSGASVAYGVSKAGLMRFTDAIAEEVTGTGVALFDLSPGLVRTGMTANRPDLDALPEAAWSKPEATAEKVIELASGDYDALTGRFIKLSDDLGELAGQIDGDMRLLRMQPVPDAGSVAK